MRNFKVLETFRFIGALLIATGHFIYWTGNNENFPFPFSFILIVDFFFVLSGFVITLKQDKKIEKTDEYLNDLFVGRTIRLLIPYIFLAIVYHLVYINLIYHQRIGIYSWIINLFLLFIVGLPGRVGGGPIGVAWALGLEFWIGTMYFPLIYFIKKKFKKGLLFISMILFIYSMGIIKQYSTTFMGIGYWKYSEVPFGILRILSSYSIGVICSILYKKLVKNFKFMKNKKVFFSLLEILILLILFRLYGKVNYNRENEFVFPIIIGVFIVIFSFENGIISKILSKVSNLGKLSYSIYLIHPFFVDLLVFYKIKNLNKYIVISYFVFILLSSWLFYYFVERKVINLKYYFLNKKITTN